MRVGLFGFFFLLLGLLHFSRRDRDEQARAARRASYFGLTVRGRGARTVFAAVELAVGAAFIAMSLLTR
jgi:hypothetical protein